MNAGGNIPKHCVEQKYVGAFRFSIHHAWLMIMAMEATFMSHVILLIGTTVGLLGNNTSWEHSMHTHAVVIVYCIPAVITCRCAHMEISVSVCLPIHRVPRQSTGDKVLRGPLPL